MTVENLDKSSESKVSESLSAEIEGAIETSVKKDEEVVVDANVTQDQDVDDRDKDLPDAEALAAEEAAKAEKGKVDEAAKPVITDSHIERAIKAGMTIADAKAFGSVESFERVCTMLEAKAGGDADSATTKKTGEDADGLLDSIPDLDPEEYDEKLVGIVKSLKDFARQQLAVNAELRQQGTKSEVDWLDGQIQGLGEGYAEAVGVGAKAGLQAGSPQAAKRAEVERKFKVLEAGYKAAGEEVSRDSVFREAVSLTLGEVSVKVAEADKAKALENREKLLVARGSGQRAKVKTDVWADAAEAVDRKYGKK